MYSLRRAIRSILLEMAVRQDILDSVKGTRKKTMLLGKKLDFSTWSNGRRYQSSYGNQIKPIGLWYGYGSEWIDFAMDPANKGLSGMVIKSEFFYELEVHYTTIENPDNDKVLLLKNHKDVNKLSKLIDGEINRIGGIMMVNWDKVASLFGGLEVSDELDSYFGWDIPSGCVWSEKAIKNIKLIQDPNTMQGIPRGLAAAGITANFNANAKTYGSITNYQIRQLIDDLEEDQHWDGFVQHETAEIMKDPYYDNIWKALAHAFNMDEEDWWDGAVAGQTYISDYQMLSAALWIITHMDTSTGRIYGAASLVPRLPRTVDYDEALENVNKYLENVSKQLNMGLSKIDLDSHDEWYYAVSAELAAEDGF